MKITNKKDMSFWAYEQCLEGNDTEAMRSYLIEPEYVYLYCTHIKYRPEIRKLISDDEWNYVKDHIEDKDEKGLIKSMEGFLHEVSKFVKNGK